MNNSKLLEDKRQLERDLASSHSLVQSAKFRSRRGMHDNFVKGEYHPSAAVRATPVDARPKLPPMQQRIEPFENPVNLPDELILPELPDVQLETLHALEPELKDFDLHQIRRALAMNGQRIMGMFQRIHLEAPKEALPDVMDSPVTDLALAQCATHLLAVYASADPLHAPSAAERVAAAPRTRREVALYMTHRLHIAAHCARLPPFADCAPTVRSRATAGSVVNFLRLPVVPLRLPDPPTWPVVEKWIYTMNAVFLAKDLIPVEWPADLADDLDGTRRREFVRDIAAHPTDLLSRCLRVTHGAYQNAIALGVNQVAFWDLLLFAWGVLTAAVKHQHGIDAGVAHLYRRPRAGLV